MPYVVTRLKPRKREINLLDLLNYKITPDKVRPYTRIESTATRTYCYDKISPSVLSKIDIPTHIEILEKFYERYKEFDVYGNEQYNYKLQVELKSKFKNDEEAIINELAEHGYSLLKFYDTFWIPKRSSSTGKRKWRQIDNPCFQLKEALCELKNIFEVMMDGCTYHSAAFAYIPGRSCKDALTKHAQNKSRWFLKLDFSNFFGNTTFDFVMNMLSDVFPFSEIVKFPEGKTALENCLHLCFLDGGLPQGTPMSPIITNIMMIAFDHKLSNGLGKQSEESPSGIKHGYVYTRYADDLLISNRIHFEPKKIEDYIINILEYYNSPFSLNKEKTRYGSNAGANWNLGLMLNENCEITVGYRRKKRLEAALSNYLKDRKAGVSWTLGDLEHLQGEISYCKSIEKDNIERILKEYEKKYNTGEHSSLTIKQLLVADIKSAI